MADKSNYRITYDMSQDSGDAPYHYVPRRKMTFGRHEGRQILVAFLALVAAFLILQTVHGGRAVDIPLALAISVVAVLTGFLLHELMHKYFAQKFGAWAEFRYSFFGLIVGIFTSILGFIIAAPGAVYISGNLSRKENGVVSAAGPLTNTAFAFIFTASAAATIPFAPAWSPFFGTVAFLDAILGVFNMIPVPPLDGSKVLMWDVRAYLICLLLPILAIVGIYYLNILTLL